MPVEPSPSIGSPTCHLAAIYVRMSSSPQDHSIEHQCSRLYHYAEERNIQIVRMYADAGKSGLSINNRSGLRELIADVQGGRADFGLVLVYDISRWGRFQDVDEGAHYEFICRKAGIQVVYCTEQFENDGSPITSILKGLKRTMAAEYSRELSAKVFAAQCRFAEKGYKMGGFAGYGLRRISFDREGKQRRVLAEGERKGATTDRVRFGWGELNEIDVVRQIYAWYLDDYLGDSAIAQLLNRSKVPAERGLEWRPWHVKAILTNEKYTGRVVFNRASAKLNGKRQANPHSDWIVVDDMLPPIVTHEVFERAANERKRRMRSKESEELLEMLRSLHKKYGRVTVAIINAENGIPNSKYFGSRFGSVADAYLAAGLPTGKTLAYARTKNSIRTTLHASMAAACTMINRAGAQFVRCAHRWSLLINDCVILKVVVARARRDQEGRIRWRIPVHAAPVPDFVLCVQMDASNVQVLAYYLIPTSDFSQGHIILRAECQSDRAQYRYETLASVFGVSL